MQIQVSCPRKGAILFCTKEKKDIQNNSQEKKDKMTNSDVQHTTQKTKDLTTRPY